MERTNSTDPEYKPAYSQAPLHGYAAAAAGGIRKGPPTSAIERQLAREALRESVSFPRSRRTQDTDRDAESTDKRSRRLVSIVAGLVLVGAAVSTLYLRPDIRFDLERLLGQAELHLEQYWQLASLKLEETFPSRTQQQKQQPAIVSQPADANPSLPVAGPERFQRAEAFLRGASTLVPELQTDPRFKTLLAEMEAAARSGDR